MMGRVAAAFASVMLLLFGASVALGRGECGHGATQSQAPLERRAEEVTIVDLEVDVGADLVVELRSIVVKDDAHDVEHTSGDVDVAETEAITRESDRRCETKAVGAAGVHLAVVTSVFDYNDDIDQHGRQREVMFARAPSVQLRRTPSACDGIFGRKPGSGRFTGAVA